MRFTFRAGALAIVAALTTTVMLFRADSAPQAVAAQRNAELPADLAMVPADAVGFVHIRLADLWKNDVMEPFRKTWEKAGPKALAALDAQFVPAPSTISRGTAFVMLDEKKKPHAVGVLTFSTAFDPIQVVKHYLPNSNTVKVGDKNVYRSADSDLELYFPDNKHLVIGFDGSLAYYLSKPPAKSGPIASAIALAASNGKVIVATADIASMPIPAEAFEQVPADIRPILKAKQLTVAVDLGPNASLDVRATYGDVVAAQDAERAVKALTDLGRAELAKLKKELEDKLYDPNAKTPRSLNDLPEVMAAVFGIGALNRLDETLADSKFIVREKAELTLAVPMPKELLVVVGGTTAIGAGLLLPAVQKVREAAGRMKSQNNLKQIALALHNYHDAHGHFPSDILDKDGKPILSWRVAILPYLEQDNVYKQFKLDEPWDSENNKPLSKLMIPTFISPTTAQPRPDVGVTSYQGISGPDTIFEAGKKIRLGDITDGSSNTIMLIETEEFIPWAKPGDYVVDPKKPLPKIVTSGGKDTFNAALCDGSVRTIHKNIAEKTLRAFFTRNGGEIVDFDK